VLCSMYGGKGRALTFVCRSELVCKANTGNTHSGRCSIACSAERDRDINMVQNFSTSHVLTVHFSRFVTACTELLCPFHVLNNRTH
jgi:hypothetical protein